MNHEKKHPFKPSASAPDDDAPPASQTNAAPTSQTKPSDHRHGAETSQVLSQDADELHELREQVAQLQDQNIRALAEVQNARRRADEEISKIRKFAVESFAQSLLAVVDSMEAALTTENASVQQWREGVQATHEQLVQILERHKVVVVNPQPGDKFNPEQEQAISVVPSDQPAGSIAQVLQKGYLIADRVLRPALVMVAEGKAG